MREYFKEKFEQRAADERARAAADSTAAANATRPAALPTNQPAGVPYFEFQVEVPVRPASGSVHPRYPAELEAANVEGEVQAQFVVDTSGLVDVTTFRVLRSNHGMFTDAVRQSLPGMRFLPAEARGRKVRHVVQQPYRFRQPR